MFNSLDSKSLATFILLLQQDQDEKRIKILFLSKNSIIKANISTLESLKKHIKYVETVVEKGSTRENKKRIYAFKGFHSL